jgi:hypothetical protein
VQGVTVQNNSDHAYSTSQQITDNLFASVIFPLPEGAHVIEIPGSHQRYHVLEEFPALVDTVPILPGNTHSIQLAYFLPFSATLLLEQQLPYRLTGDVRILVHPAELAVRSEHFIPVGTTDSSARYMGSVNLAPGENLRFELYPPYSDAGGIQQLITLNRLSMITIAIFIGAGIFAGGMFMVHKHLNNRVAAHQSNPANDVLAHQIAMLDSAYEQGELDEKSYQQQRQHLKTQLREQIKPPTQKP